MIKAKNLTFEYFNRDKEDNVTKIVSAIMGIDFQMKAGDYIAIMGANGSGKSTFAKLLNRTYLGSEGVLTILGKDSFDAKNIMDIRKNVGMIFQNPENQIVGTIVFDEVAFGPENLNLELEEIWENVLGSLEAVGLSAYRNYFTNELSGGQLQKVALAGVLAMEPKCIIFDESTSMLSEKDRISVLALIKLLNEKLNISIINITHFPDEAMKAKKLYIMDNGSFLFSGSPSEVFINDKLKIREKVGGPKILTIANMLWEQGVISRKDIFDIDELCKLIITESYRDTNKYQHPSKFIKPIIDYYEEVNSVERDITKSIIYDKVSYRYSNNLNGIFKDEFIIENIDLTFGKNEFIMVTGDSGTGKTTLLKMANGILTPNSGDVYVGGQKIGEKGTSLEEIRKKVVFGFQFPEEQLFGKNVFQDVVFGPRNLGLSKIEAEKRAFEAIEAVGLPDTIYDTSIRKLSGGEKRRVALAGLLAMSPEFLILDEPTASLDAIGKSDFMQLLKAVQVQTGMTIIVISHDIDSCSEVATRYIRMHQGSIDIDCATEIGILKAFYKSENYTELPEITKLLIMLRKRGMPVRIDICQVNKGIEEIVNISRSEVIR